MEASFFLDTTACCFTGHRPEGLPGGGDETGEPLQALTTLLDNVVDEAISAGVTMFLAGGAAGFDTLAGEAVMRAKKRGANIRLVLALPSRLYLPMRERLDYLRLTRLMDVSDNIFYASVKDNGRNALLARDRFMVEHADCCVAYLNSRSGGTAYTVRYARSLGLPVRNLAEELRI